MKPTNQTPELLHDLESELSVALTRWRLAGKPTPPDRIVDKYLDQLPPDWTPPEEWNNDSRDQHGRVTQPSHAATLQEYVRAYEDAEQDGA